MAACCSDRQKSTVETVAVDRPSSVGAGAALQGIVRLAGNVVPAPARVENTTDPQVCGHTHVVANLVVSAANRGVADAIVRLRNVPQEKIPPVAPSRLTLDNVDCRFTPRVSVLTVGSTIDAANSDPILHTTHLYGAREANIALPLKGMRIPITVENLGMIIVKCDVHGWMQAFVQVDEHPFHAVTGPTGSFQISNIPPGTYELVAWHEVLGERQMMVSVSGAKPERVEIEYSLNAN
jgi:plastocyanin